MNNFKQIHVGHSINQLVLEKEIEISRICKFFKTTEDRILEMYNQSSLDSDLILKWCKLLDYDLFRIYSQHLILYSPPASRAYNSTNAQKKSATTPQFRKNVYTKEVIDFILEQVKTGDMSKQQIMERYKIPKTTLYKWIRKYEAN